MGKRILITGASGLIGKSLTKYLLQQGYEVHHLSRETSAKDPEIKTFIWDVYKQQIDEACLDGVDAIVHLVGEGIAAKPWTSARKQQIIESRTKSIRLLYDVLKKKDHQVKQIVSASAVGFYGDRGDELLTEESKAGHDFLSHACLEWEHAVDEGKQLGLKVIKLRTGLVLSKEGGALPQLAKPVSIGLGTILGSGKQWMPWIHIQDVVRMYEFALEKNLPSGAYNMTAPHPVTNALLTQKLAFVLHKPLWLPKVPALLLRIVLGEMYLVVLDSTKTSADKILTQGFEFKFLSLNDALNNLYDATKAG